MKIVHWYDTHTKLWVVQLLDDDDNQIGTAEYTPKVGLAAAIEMMEEKKKEMDNG